LTTMLDKERNGPWGWSYWIRIRPAEYGFPGKSLPGSSMNTGGKGREVDKRLFN
jgi:hypothetical protein